MNLFKILFISLLFFFGCSGDNNVYDIGTVKLSLTNVPSSVACLKIAATNSVRSVERSVDLISAAGSPGYVADTSYLEGLPTGDVILSANAYNVICDQITLTTIPTWKSFPLQEVVQIVEGIPYDWNLTMNPNGYVSPDVDWKGDVNEIPETPCNFSTYSSNNQSGINLDSQDPCKLLTQNDQNFYVSNIYYCQQMLSCMRDTNCVLSTQIFCQQCEHTVNFINHSTNAEQTFIRSIIELACSY